MHVLVSNRQAVCDALLAAAKNDPSVVVACSDSRGSGAMSPFFEQFPERAVELGIAEQDLVGVCAGLARCGKKVFAVSPAAFLTGRSYEQIKVDVAYSNVGVKLIGISGGISYGALGMSHHSAQDVAAMASLPNMRVYLPSDHVQTSALIRTLLCDDLPAYIRIGRNAVPEIYPEATTLSLDRTPVFGDAAAPHSVAILACGEMTSMALAAKDILHEKGIESIVADMFSLKPFDTHTLRDVSRGAELVVTVEEHVRHGGLGSVVSTFLSENEPKRMLLLSLPDEPVVAGKSADVFRHYGLDAQGIARQTLAALEGSV